MKHEPSHGRISVLIWVIVSWQLQDNLMAPPGELEVCSSRAPLSHIIESLLCVIVGRPRHQWSHLCNYCVNWSYSRSAVALFVFFCWQNIPVLETIDHQPLSGCPTVGNTPLLNTPRNVVSIWLMYYRLGLADAWGNLRSVRFNQDMTAVVCAFEVKLEIWVLLPIHPGGKFSS